MKVQAYKRQKKRLYTIIKKAFKRKHAGSEPISKGITRVNQVVRGWINYFKTGHENIP